MGFAAAQNNEPAWRLPSALRLDVPLPGVGARAPFRRRVHRSLVMLFMLMTAGRCQAEGSAAVQRMGIRTGCVPALFAPLRAIFGVPLGRLPASIAGTADRRSGAVPLQKPAFP